MKLQQLQKKLFEFQKSKYTLRVSVLRYLLAAIQNKEIALRAEGIQLSNEDVLAVMYAQIKQREQSIEDYGSAGRQDLVDKEASELEVLKELLHFVKD
jgi:uncharacterized protein